MTKKVVFAAPTDKIIKVSELMMKEAISQLPVVKGSKVIGTITEESIIENLRINITDELVETIMEPPLPCVAGNTGIITRSDLLKIVSE